MKKIVVYCHGYGSSPKTDKVARIAAAGFETLAYPINIDPDVSIKELVHNIMFDLLLDQQLMNAEIELVFVGTSLGGWYANKLGNIFGAKHICVNPAYNPQTALTQFGVSQEILDKYSSIEVNELTSLFIAEDDEVIDLVGGIKSGEFDIENAARVVFTKGGHRYNGVEFDAVTELLKVI
jgi:hypothetical protein